MKGLKNNFGRKLLAPVMAAALALTFGIYEAARPASAATAVTGPTAAPLDNDSVSALLSLDRAMETVAAKVTPAVVNVTVTARTKGNAAMFEPSNESDSQDQGQGQGQDDMQRFFGQFFGPQGRGMQMRPQPQVEHVGGSGVVVSPDGYIVTNNHVVEGATDVRVTFSNGRVMPAKVVGTDQLTDLAVLKVIGNNLANAPWGDSQALRPGQTVLAFGNPLGMRFTVTRGIVSAVNRSNPYSDNPRKPGGFIQTDAAINQGNSGGPLVDARGEVVGINTFLISPSGAFAGMGFAIPSQIVKPTVETLIRDGHIEHAYMGVSIEDLTPENAHFFGMNEAGGAVISQVSPDSPAERAGLKVGDVITTVDGQKVIDASSLQVSIADKRPGDKTNLGIMRDGKPLNMTLSLAAYNNKENEAAATSTEHGKARWGIGLSDVTPDARQQMGLPSSVQGALIANVQPGSPADNAGLAGGMVIVSVDRKPVRSAAEAKQALANVAPGQDVLLLVQTQGGSGFRVMHAPSNNK
jgi:serine protease Do